MRMWSRLKLTGHSPQVRGVSQIDRPTLSRRRSALLWSVAPQRACESCAAQWKVPIRRALDGRDRVEKAPRVGHKPTYESGDFECNRVFQQLKAIPLNYHRIAMRFVPIF